MWGKHRHERKSIMKRFKKLLCALCALALIPYCLACSDTNTKEPLKKFTRGNASFDHDALRTPEEVVILKSNIFKGRVIGSRLELTENVPRLADRTMIDFCTVYTVEVTENYKGTNSGIVTVIGPQPYECCEEKLAVLRENGYETDEKSLLVVDGYEELLENGEEYLFALGENNFEYFPDTFAFKLDGSEQNHHRAEFAPRLAYLLTSDNKSTVDFSIVSPISGVTPNVFYTENGGLFVTAVSQSGDDYGYIEYLPPANISSADEDLARQTFHIGESTLTVCSENKEKCEWMLEIDGVPAHFVYFSTDKQISLSDLLADAEILSISDCIRIK